MKEINVELADRSYPVIIGDGACQRLADVIPKSAKKVAVVTQSNVKVAIDPGLPMRNFVIDNGEEAKSIGTIEELCRGFAQMELSRSDCVVGVGGGVVTDTSGFAAAVYHRGVPVVHVATTLLAMVDAAVGGKTGVNIPEGKNLVGAFWQPSAVICDMETVATLPEREVQSGNGEIAKCHFLGSRVDMDSSNLLKASLEEKVAFCIELKAEVVKRDERDSGGLRNILNYGHTLAHALEIVGRFDLRHGEAVSIGVHYAALLAREMGRIDDARVNEHLQVLAAYDLPTNLPSRINIDEILQVMYRDKKSTTGTLTFVLDGPAGVETVKDVDEATVRKVLEAMPR